MFLQHTPHSEIISVVGVDLSPLLLQQIRCTAGSHHVSTDIGGSGGLLLEGSRDIHGIVTFQEAGVGLVEIRLLDEFVAVFPAGLGSGEKRGALAVIDWISY